MKPASPQKFEIALPNAGAVSALLDLPQQARACYVFAHGAGAGMTHSFMVTVAARRCPGMPLIAGGKSFGGRMTSQAQASAPLAGVRGLAFFGFPLHPAGKPSDDRAKHLFEIRIPMLFLQGSRDSLAELKLLEPVIKRLGRSATLHRVEGADHSFHVPVRSGRTDAEVMQEILDAFAGWIGTIAAK